MYKTLIPPSLYNTISMLLTSPPLVKFYGQYRGRANKVHRILNKGVMTPHY